MCGIAGLFSTQLDKRDRIARVEAACQAMLHRGPDDGGVEDFGALALGMRRLSIIDVSDAGHQPMSNEDGTVWLVANGEIYNFQELRSKLVQRDHRFRSHTDVEVILHLYEEEGIDCLRHLRGMFAFALWDQRSHELWMARDRLGIKPLYYVYRNGILFFASELKGLLAGRCLSPKLDYQALDLFLAYGYVPPPFTLLQGVQMLPAGHYARLNDSAWSLQRYWSLPEAGTTTWGEDEVLSNTRSLLDEAVTCHQISDVPIGAFLSGGIDSTALVGLMVNRGAKVKTFTIGFQEGPSILNERNLARETSQVFETDHVETVVSGKEIRDELECIVWAIDQPSFDGVNTYLISRMAKQGGLTVALSGLGGDELFGGYGTFQVVPQWGKKVGMFSTLPVFVRHGLVNMIGALLSRSLRRTKWLRLGQVHNAIDLYGAIRLSLWKEERLPLYSEELANGLDVGRGDLALGLLKESSENEPDWEMVRRLELMSYAGWRLLRDTDATSMAHSLEVRVPLLDHKLVEAVVGLPSVTWKRWGHPKQLLTACLADLLPPHVLSRPKQGFQFPMGVWLSNELREIVDDVFSAESVRRRGVFSVTGMKNLFHAYQDGDYPYEVIWQFVILELWFRSVFDCDSNISQEWSFLISV